MGIFNKKKLCIFTIFALTFLGIAYAFTIQHNEFKVFLQYLSPAESKDFKERVLAQGKKIRNNQVVNFFNGENAATNKEAFSFPLTVNQESFFALRLNTEAKIDPKSVRATAEASSALEMFTPMRKVLESMIQGDPVKKNEMVKYFEHFMVTIVFSDFLNPNDSHLVNDRNEGCLIHLNFKKILFDKVRTDSGCKMGVGDIANRKLSMTLFDGYDPQRKIDSAVFFKIQNKKETISNKVDSLHKDGSGILFELGGLKINFENYH